VAESRGKGGEERALSEAKRGTDLRQHGLEIGRVLNAANEADGRLVLWHGAAVDPHELDPLASRRNEKGLDGLELFAVGVGLSTVHPAMGDGQNLLDMCPADHLFIADGHLDERTRVLRAQLLEKGQVLAGEGAQEVRLDHPEPTRDRACWRSNSARYSARWLGWCGLCQCSTGM
jgi:hypothetical protein